MDRGNEEGEVGVYVGRDALVEGGGLVTSECDCLGNEQVVFQEYFGSIDIILRLSAWFCVWIVDSIPQAPGAIGP
jgi:hypothetical protein